MTSGLCVALISYAGDCGDGWGAALVWWFVNKYSVIIVGDCVGDTVFGSSIILDFNNKILITNKSRFFMMGALWKPNWQVFPHFTRFMICAEFWNFVCEVLEDLEQYTSSSNLACYRSKY